MRFFIDGVAQVRAVKVSDKYIGALQAQFIYDVFANPFGCGRGKCREGNSGEECPKSLNPPVLRAELMSPHGDTVCFVDGEKRYAAFLQHVHKVCLHGTLRRHIENPDFSRNCRGFN